MIKVRKGSKVIFETELDLNKAVETLIKETKNVENNNECDKVIMVIGNSVYTYNAELQEIVKAIYKFDVGNMLDQMSNILMEIEDIVAKEEGWDEEYE